MDASALKKIKYSIKLASFAKKSINVCNVRTILYSRE